MNPVDPNQNELAALIQNINKRLENLERARQPYLGDWYDFPLSLIDNVIQAGKKIFAKEGVDLRKYLQSGKKARFLRNNQTEWEYGIIYAVSQNYFKIYSQNNLQASDTIKKLSIALSDTPSGFPGVIPYVHTTNTSGVTILNEYSKLGVSGNRADVYLEVRFKTTQNMFTINLVPPIVSDPELSNIFSVMGRGIVKDEYMLAYDIVYYSTPPSGGGYIMFRRNHPPDYYENEWLSQWEAGISYLLQLSYFYYLI